MRPGIQILLFVLGLFGLSCAPARAQGTLAGRPVATCVAPVQTGDTWQAMMQATSRFDCRRDQRSFGPGSFWVIARGLPPNAGTREPVVIRHASLREQAASLYVRYADGDVASQHADSRQVSRLINLGGVVEWRLPHRHSALQTLLWRIDRTTNVRGIVVGASVATRDQSATATLAIGALYAAFGAMCLTLLVYNLAIWVALRHRFQLTYCAMLIALMAYASAESGVLAWMWPRLDDNVRIGMLSVTLALAAAAALRFAQSFFEPRVFEGWLTHVARLVSAAAVTSAVAFAVGLGDPVLLDRCYALSMAALIATSVPIMWRAWRRRSDYLRVFALAWGGPILFAAVRLSYAFDLLPWSFWIDSSTMLSMACEALLSSLAIAYRINLLSRERDAASARELAALRLADIDPLTGLYNRRALLREALARGGRQMLVLADIDHFKLINETLGHDGGDEVLRVISRALRTAGPPGTLVARLGGEEFALLAPEGARLVPAAVLDAVRAERMPFDVAVTVSLGSCTAPLVTELDWKMLYRRADIALFAAKDAGRDRARDAALIAA